MQDAMSSNQGELVNDCPMSDQGQPLMFCISDDPETSSWEGCSN